MIEITTKELAHILQGELIGDPNQRLSAVSTDSRQITPQGIFFALKGDNFDGHQYVENAMEQGCLALVVEMPCAVSCPQIIVPNTKRALGELAQWLKARISPKTVAITGSSGKTTVKEMTASILAYTAKRLGLGNNAVLATIGNFNNDIGVPLTLLRLTNEVKFAVIELGANHQGEIAYTTALVKPNVALINNFAPAHLEGFKSLNGVMEAKGEIFQGLEPDGIAIINADCHSLPHWQSQIGERKIQQFSLKDSQADYFAEHIQLYRENSTFTLHTPQGKVDISLAFSGIHNVANALAATSLSLNLGANLDDVVQGLRQKMASKGRLCFEQIGKHLCVIDDTYNANVASMQASIAVLQQQAGFRILVLGDMGELGEQSQHCHEQVGRFAQLARLDCVMTLGEKSRVIAEICEGKSYLKIGALNEDLFALIQEKIKQNQDVTVLVKGSRSMHMEDVVHTLKENIICSSI